MGPNKALTRNSPIYLITDSAISRLSHVQALQQAIKAGVEMIQLREKNLSKKDLFNTALTIRKMTQKHNVFFIVNDYIDIALAVDADGVHLGQEDMPVDEARKIMGTNKLIGISTHSVRQALEAQNSGADYIGFGPIFYTATKDAGQPKGIASIRKIKKHIKIPLVAIGGITWENAYKVLRAGADAVAVASGILDGNIKDNFNRFIRAVECR